MGKPAVLRIDVAAKVDEAVRDVEHLTDKIGGIGKGQAAGLSVAAGITGELIAAGKAAAEQQVQIAQLATTYANFGGSADDAAKAMDHVEATTRRTGQSTEDAAAAYNALVMVTKSTSTANTDLAAAEDLAAARHMSVADAANVLIKAHEGQYRGLKALGVATTDAQGNALSYEQVLKNLTDTVHGQANAYGDTAVGRLNRFKETWSQTQEQIGAGVLPVMGQLLDMLQPLFTWLSNNQEVLSKLAPILAVIAAVIYTVVLATKVWTAVQTALDVVLAANPIMLVVIAVAALIGGVILAYQHVKVFHDAVQKLWDVLYGVWEFVVNHWQLMISVMLGPLGILIANWRTVEDVIGRVIGLVQRVIDLAGKVPGFIGGLVGHIPGFGGLSVAPPAPGSVNVTVTVPAGADVPDAVYRALRDYQRRHNRPELAALFGPG